MTVAAYMYFEQKLPGEMLESEQGIPCYVQRYMYIVVLTKRNKNVKLGLHV